ncbi:MAG: hypothetical protein WB930_02530 [Syntrophobacteraceae bacterium]
MSNRRGKFIELAEKRVTRTIKDLRLIGNLSNRNNYDFTEHDVSQILSALDAEVRKLRTQFKGDNAQPDVKFKIKLDV